MNSMLPFIVPADVPSNFEQEYKNNYLTITQQSGRLLLFSCDQKMEHLNDDFYGEGIHPDAMDPKHLFTIAASSPIGAMATHLGLITRYAAAYPTIPFIAKLNGKTNAVSPTIDDPLSYQLWSIDDVMRLKKNSNINLCGIGFTVYLGSRHEATMLAQAAQLITQAHAHGLIAIIWAYPRGNSIKADHDYSAGAAGLAAALGADFVKINAPAQSHGLRIATLAAGNTKVICSGGPAQNPEDFLTQLYAQLHEGGTAGAAVGRNIFQRDTVHATALVKAMRALIVEQRSLENGLKIYQEANR